MKSSIKITGIVAGLLLILAGCHNRVSDNGAEQAYRATDTSFRMHVSYAKWFRIRYENSTKVIDIIDPWDSTHIMVTYVFLEGGRTPEKKIPGVAYIDVPVKSMACQFTPQLGFAEKLGIIDQITGMSRPDFIFNPVIRERIREKKIALFGEPNNPDLERLLAINPQILIVSPFKDNRYERIRKAGITLAIDASYMEESPLGRAEWIKFIASFFGKDLAANRIFDSIATNYLAIKKQVAGIRERPTIMSGKKFQDNWYISGGKSYMAQFLNDAGFDYIWNDLRITGSIPIDFETVYKRAAQCAYWSFIESPTGPYSYDQIMAEYAPYADFPAFKERHIIMCDTGKTPYYETGIMEPDIILSDFVRVAHPEILPGYDPVYFKLLQ